MNLQKQEEFLGHDFGVLFLVLWFLWNTLYIIIGGRKKQPCVFQKMTQKEKTKFWKKLFQVRKVILKIFEITERHGIISNNLEVSFRTRKLQHEREIWCKL